MPRSLIEAIHIVADCPCELHQQAFLGALKLTDELLFKVVDSNVPALDGPHQVGPGEAVKLAQASVHGRTYLLSFPDLDAAHRHDPESTYIGIERDYALRMVLANPELDGLLVVAATDNDAWAAAPRERLTALLPD